MYYGEELIPFIWWNLLLPGMLFYIWATELSEDYQSIFGDIIGMVFFAYTGTVVFKAGAAIGIHPTWLEVIASTIFVVILLRVLWRGVTDLSRTINRRA